MPTFFLERIFAVFPPYSGNHYDFRISRQRLERCPQRVSRYLHCIWRIPAVCREKNHSDFSVALPACPGVFLACFRKSSQCVLRGPQNVFRGSATCFGCFRGVFPGYPKKKFFNGSPGRSTSAFKCGCDWFFLLHAAVFRLVAISDLWEEGRVLAENSKVPEGVPQRVLNLSGRDVCRKERNRRFTDSIVSRSIGSGFKTGAKAARKSLRPFYSR